MNATGEKKLVETPCGSGSIKADPEKIKITYRDSKGEIHERVFERGLGNTINIGLAIIPIKEIKHWMKALYGMEVIEIQEVQQ